MLLNGLKEYKINGRYYNRLLAVKDNNKIMIKSFNDFFEFVKKRTFIEQFTNIPYNTGVSQRFAGSGTQPNDKRTEPTEQELIESKAGWVKFKSEGDKFFKGLK